MSKNVTPIDPIRSAHTRKDRMRLAHGYMARMCDLANEGGQLGHETLQRLQRGSGLRLERDGDGVFRVVGEPIGLLDETPKDRGATLKAARGASIPGVHRASDLMTEPVTEIATHRDDVTENQADVTKNADVTKKRGRPRKSNAMTPTERKRAERDRKKAERARERGE